MPRIRFEGLPAVSSCTDFFNQQIISRIAPFLIEVEVDYMRFYDERLSNCLLFIDLVEVKKNDEYGGRCSDLCSSKTMFFIHQYIFTMLLLNCFLP